MNDAEVDERRCEPAPKLLSCRSGWVIILTPNAYTVEATNVTKTVDLYTVSGQ